MSSRAKKTPGYREWRFAEICPGAIVVTLLKQNGREVVHSPAYDKPMNQCVAEMCGEFYPLDAVSVALAGKPPQRYVVLPPRRRDATEPLS